MHSLPACFQAAGSGNGQWAADGPPGAGHHRDPRESLSPEAHSRASRRAVRPGLLPGSEAPRGNRQTGWRGEAAPLGPFHRARAPGLPVLARHTRSHGCLHLFPHGRALVPPLSSTSILHSCLLTLTAPRGQRLLMGAADPAGPGVSPGPDGRDCRTWPWWAGRTLQTKPWARDTDEHSPPGGLSGKPCSTEPGPQGHWPCFRVSWTDT